MIECARMASPPCLRQIEKLNGGLARVFRLPNSQDARLPRAESGTRDQITTPYDPASAM